MNKSNPSLIPLQRASLCLDCEVITPAQKSCLACGSAALLNVARALSRPQCAGIAGLSNPAIASMPRRHYQQGTNFMHSTLDAASGGRVSSLCPIEEANR